MTGMNFLMQELGELLCFAKASTLQSLEAVDTFSLQRRNPSHEHAVTAIGFFASLAMAVAYLLTNYETNSRGSVEHETR